MALYIGANYHPHDWPRERWRTDIGLMKDAGFTTVRMGHLCWDSYEPEEGVYTFEWFDEVMALCEEMGIGVVLDVSMHPAPAWVHQLCPGCQIYGKSGTKQESLTRYMEDVDDSVYQQYALRFAEQLVNRYKDHPALFAFGLCNELGSGMISYSPYARKRFQSWLKKKYRTVEALNQSWAAWRWSRRLNSFEDAALQENEVAIGSPEAWLDMRRFYSEGIGSFLVRLKEVVERNAPGIPHSSNHYAERSDLGFDYLKFADRFVDYPGMGLYPGYEAGSSMKWRSLMVVYMQRLAETDRPMWCLEYQTGSKGVSHGPCGVNRMHMFLSLIYRAQMILGWTFRSMLGGEEQYLYGMLGHDGIPGPNYEEYRQTASDFHKLEKYAFPYLPKPEIGVAYGYENMLVMQYQPCQYRTAYEEQVMAAVECLDRTNRDYNIVDLRNLKRKYRLLVIPGYVLMGKEAAETVRRFVEEGGCAVMTGYSAIVEESGKVTGEKHPGYLADVFGIRVKGNFRAGDKETGYIEPPSILFDGQEIVTDKKYFEELELGTAESLAVLSDSGECVISENVYGQGKAYYLAMEADAGVLEALVDRIAEKAGLGTPLMTPEGVVGRRIAEHQYFYVNTLKEAVEVPLPESGQGVLKGRECQEILRLDPLDAELLVSAGGGIE